MTPKRRLFKSFMETSLSWIDGKYGTSYPVYITNELFSEIAVNRKSEYDALVVHYKGLNSLIARTLAKSLKASSGRSVPSTRAATTLIKTYKPLKRD